MSLSVVVASIVGPPFLDHCLQSLESEARRLDAEVIVVACGTEDQAERIARQFPWVRLIHRRQRETVPALRRLGVLAAEGDIVAIIEEHCVAAEGWLHEAVKALESGAYGACGGPVVDDNYGRLCDWVVYFCEYNGYLPPFEDGETTDLNGANIAYRRQLLLRHETRLAEGYWEASLHPILLAEGVRFRSAPAMRVHHCGPFDFFLLPPATILVQPGFCGSAPANAVPGTAIDVSGGGAARSRRVAGAHGRPGVAQTLPTRLVPGLGAADLGSPARLVAGEWIGYLAGPGDALLKVE